MNTLVAVLVTGFATGVVPLIVAVLSYRQSREANRQARVLENRKVDAAAFMDAQRIYKDAIATLESQLASARGRITELERRLDASDRRGL